jgi:hypothetical protein
VWPGGPVRQPYIPTRFLVPIDFLKIPPQLIHVVVELPTQSINHVGGGAAVQKLFMFYSAHPPTPPFFGGGGGGASGVRLIIDLDDDVFTNLFVGLKVVYVFFNSYTSIPHQIHSQGAQDI